MPTFSLVLLLSHSLARRLFLGSAMLVTSGLLVLAGKPIASQGTPGAANLDDVSLPAQVETEPDLEDVPVGEPQFDTTPWPLPPNIPSVSFEATGTSELGDLVRLAEHVHYVDSVTVALSSWAIRSDFPGSSPLGFTHAITLRLYRVDRRSGTPEVGDPIATVTQPFLIPWRPEPDPASTSPLRPWRAADGNYYTGRAFTITFELSPLALSLPDEVIFGISFNTQHHGPEPTGSRGPYNWLHVGVGVEPPAAGADLEPDAVFWRTTNAADYADGGRSGADVFRRDTAWTPFKPAVRFNNSAYGALAVVSARLGALPAADSATAAVLERTHTLTTWALDRRLWDGNNHLQASAGRLVFDLLAEAVDELGGIAAGSDATAARTQGAIDSLLRVSRSLAESAVADALLGSPYAERVMQAQDALDDAYHHEGRAHFDQAIDHFGSAWGQAELSLR